MAPSGVEERYARQQAEPVQQLDVPDSYTVYLVQSKSAGKIKISWCGSGNLQQKFRNLRKECPDAELVSRSRLNQDKRLELLQSL